MAPFLYIIKLTPVIKRVRKAIDNFQEFAAHVLLKKNKKQTIQMRIKDSYSWTKLRVWMKYYKRTGSSYKRKFIHLQAHNLQQKHPQQLPFLPTFLQIFGVQDVVNKCPWLQHLQK